MLSGILPNEGIFYVEGDLEYSSQKHHENMHCDLILSWNDTHRDALLANDVAAPECIQSVGVPRFDFYTSPWSKLYQKERLSTTRPIILANSNFLGSPLRRLTGKGRRRVFCPLER